MSSRTANTTLIVVMVAALVMIGAVVAIILSNKATPTTLTGQEYPVQGRDHVAVGASHPSYNSNPPTSGWHYAQPLQWGIYPEEVADEAAVHNLEHGGIWITYNPDRLSAQAISELNLIAKSYRKVVMSPRKQNDSAIALTSWGRLDKLDSIDTSRIEDFIRRNLNHALELID